VLLPRVCWYLEPCQYKGSCDAVKADWWQEPFLYAFHRSNSCVMKTLMLAVRWLYGASLCRCMNLLLELWGLGLLVLVAWALGCKVPQLV